METLTPPNHESELSDLVLRFDTTTEMIVHEFLRQIGNPDMTAIFNTVVNDYVVFPPQFMWFLVFPILNRLLPIAVCQHCFLGRHRYGPVSIRRCLDKKYKPHYLKQDARRDAYDKEIENAKKERAKKERANSQHTDSQPRTPNAHLTVLMMLVMNCLLFEFFLQMDANDSPCSFYELCNIIFTHTQLTLEQLIDTRIFDTYEARWESEWRWMLGDITFALIRKLSKQCYNCDRRPGNDPATRFGFHLDHLLDFWKKVNGVSQFVQKGLIYMMISEALGTRLVCIFCHEHGRIPNFNELLQYQNQLTYDFGSKHRSAREILASREVRSLILDLRSRGAFSMTVALPCSWQTLQVVVWDHFRIVLEDATHYREDNWISWSQKHRHKIATRIVDGVCKMLSVKCANPECGEYFTNMNAISKMGGHWNHRGPKRLGPSQAATKGIDAWVRELKRGDCDLTCGCCHGKLNKFQYLFKRELIAKEDAPEWIRASL